MEKRTLIAIALSIVVLMVFKYVEDRRLGQQARHTPQNPRMTPGPPPPLPPVEETGVPAPVTSIPDVARAQTDTVALPQSIVVDGKLYRAVVDNRGALLTS